jgi:hypothetical protein
MLQSCSSQFPVPCSLFPFAISCSLLPIPFRYFLFPTPYSLLCVTVRWEQLHRCGSAPSHFWECAKRDENPTNQVAAPQTGSLSWQGVQEKNSSKLNERRGNVYENKGTL